MQKIFTPRLITALLAVAFAGSAQASGFQLLGEQSASGIGNAGAGSAAVAENASTIFYNPAGMTQLQAREVSLGGTLVKTNFEFSNNGSSTGALTGDGGNGGALGFVPNAYMSWAITKDLYLGVGIGAPFGLKTEYDDNWRGAAQSISFDIKTMNINPSIAWRATEWMSLGFGLNWQRVDAEYIRRVSVVSLPANALGPGSPAMNFSAATATLNLSDDAWGWNAGVLFNIGPATKVGLSYRSTIKYETEGDVSVSGSGSATGNTAAAFLNARGASSDTTASIKMPDTFILSAAHKLNSQWELLGDASWTGWSSIPKVDIMRASGVLNGQVAQVLDTDFRDTWRFAVGANYTMNDAWKLKLGIAYDQTPVKDPEHRLVSMPDNNRTWFSAGAQWKMSKTMTFDIGAAYLYLKDAEINNDQRSAATSPQTNRGLVKGTYEDSAFLLGAQFSMAF